MTHNITLLAATLLIVACGSSTPTHRTDDLQKIINQELFIPTDGIAWRYGTTDTTISLSSDRYKIVAYFDDSGCSACRLKELFCWNPIIRDAQQLSLPLDFIFIIHSDTTNIEIAQNPALATLKAPIIFDPIGLFELRNIIPQQSNMHYFLLNEDNRIEMLGNPSYKPELWVKFKKRIAERVN